jgi:hypothetical protein
MDFFIFTNTAILKSKRCAEKKKSEIRNQKLDEFSYASNINALMNPHSTF